ncbi:MAG: C4-dicarboxylate ABC transporter [Gammaproteobacteria bacterium SG8_30]|nr:MAG: C4-dicarboxylate ABC transporter [Gammaproteobacteria bacterium SG8_30]
MTSQPTVRENRHTSPVIVLLGILLVATALTYLVESGAYQREGRLVVPDSYQTLEKDRSLSHLFDTSRERTPGVAKPVSLIDTLMAIPEGLERMAGLIFMVLMIGGMFGILTHSGAVDAGLERLLSGIRGNVYVLVPVLMLVFSAGSTFLGLASEYLLVIPLMVAMANRLGLSSVTGLAIVTVAVKAGYLSSVSNPIPLSIAQPLVGLQVFSGAGFRFLCYLVFLAAGVVFVLFMVRREGHDHGVVREFDHAPLSARHRAILLLIGAGVAILVYGSNRWHWSHEELSAYYIGLSVAIAAASGIGPSEAADAFVRGMKKILMATMLIGVASAVAITLEHGQVLDSIVHGLTGLIGEDGAWVAAVGMFFSQLLLDFLIPSTSGQAAVSMPILGPLGQLTGVSPQTTVLAFLFGNGITNLLTPTSGTLLAYLAAAQVGWVQWARYAFWLWLIYIGIAILMLTVALGTGF